MLVHGLVHNSIDICTNMNFQMLLNQLKFIQCLIHSHFCQIRKFAKI